MNKVIMCGRLTRDPEIRYGGTNNGCIAKFDLAVDRRFKREGQPTADFFKCVAFGKTGEFVEKYLRKGTKIFLDGELQNDNYANKEGRMIYGMQIVVSQVEFAESRAASQQNGNGGNTQPEAPSAPGDFMQVDDSVEDDGIPFA